MWRRCLIVCGLAGAMAASAWAAPAGAPTYPPVPVAPAPGDPIFVTPLEVVIESANNVPSVRAARANAEGVQALSKGAAAPENPSLQVGTATIDNNLNTSQLNQNFNVFGEYGLRGRAASAESQAAWCEFQVAQRQAIREAVTAYYTLWVSTQKLDLARLYLEALQKLHATAAARNPHDPRAHALLRTQVEIARAEADVTAARAARDSDRARLNATLGHVEDENLGIPDDGRSVDLEAPRDPYMRDIPSLDHLLTLSQSRPEVRASQLRVSATRSRANLSNLSGLPYLGIQGNLDRWNVPTATRGFQLTFNLPLFDWGSLKAARKQAWKEYEAAGHTVDAALIQVHLDVRTAWQAWVSALSRQSQLAASIDDFREAFEEGVKQYEEGKLSVDDMINTLKGSREGFQQYLEAEGAVHTTRVDLLWAAGVDLLPPASEGTDNR